MISNIFKHSFKALKKQKSYVLINVFGLAIGLSASLLIALYIVTENSFDNYHENKDHIYKVILNGKISQQEVKVTSTASPIGPAMAREFPEIKDFLRMNEWGETVIKNGDQSFIEQYYIEADSSFFNFFSLNLLRGNKKTALKEPFSVVLTASAASRIFGNKDPMNKMLKIGTSPQFHRVTGIMQDIPENTHFEANMIGSFTSNPRADDKQWLANSFHTYVMLYPETDPADVDARFKDLIIKYVGPEIYKYMGIRIEDFLSQGNKYSLFLQPLSRIKTDPTIDGTFMRASDPKYFWIFGGIGLLVLLIASINFMNLSTAQATKRAREVGIKKVSGSSRKMLIGQFLTETVFLSLIAMLISLIIVEVSTPWFNQMLGLNLSISNIGIWYFFPSLLLAVIVIGILSGIYPAFYMSKFNPNEVLKGKATHSRSNISLRSLLTVLQFSISIILIITTLIMHRQIRYMLNKDLGYNTSQLMVIRGVSALQQQLGAFKEELKQIPGVVSASASTAVPGHSNNNNGYMMRGRPEESFLLQTNWVDYDYLETYGIELAEGRFFDPEMLTDRQACIINERTVRNFNIDDPFSTQFAEGDLSNEEVTVIPVIGVTRDFHFESLHHDIQPYIMRFREENAGWGYISVKFSENVGQQLIKQIEELWASFTANDPLLYFFLDQDLRTQYLQERQNASMSLIFTVLAVIIASLGLYGLMSFAVSQRIKEIGIRKTFGASVSNIWLMICREMFILIIIATFIAWPVVWWLGSNWLDNFQFRTSINLTDFLAGFLISAIIAVITISYRTIRSARMNPSIALRYE